MPVIDALKEIGGGADTTHHAFNQAAYRGQQDRIDGVSIANGYCAGVVLDWARRVLLSASNRNETYLNFSNKPANSDTLSRMVGAYAGQAPNYVAETNRTKALTLLRSMQTRPETNRRQFGLGVDVSNDDALLFKKIWAVPGGANGPFRKFDFQYEVAGTLSKANILMLIDDLESSRDQQHVARDSNGRLWDHFAAELDQRHIAQRRRVGREAKKLFSNIKVERTSTLKRYESGGAWMSELLHNSLKLEGCTVYTFAPNDGGTGHAVAVYQKTNSQYLFFDPNYGVFVYTKEQLQNCFQHLFWSRWANADRQDFDGALAVYLRRDNANSRASSLWNTMGYTVFVAR